jgi:hypothetical protein
MARRQKQPHEGDIWVRSSDEARVRVVSVRARSVSYENITTLRRGSSAVIGFLKRFAPAAVVYRVRLPSNVVNIKSARPASPAPRGRHPQIGGGGFATSGSGHRKH